MTFVFDTSNEFLLLQVLQVVLVVQYIIRLVI